MPKLHFPELPKSLHTVKAQNINILIEEQYSVGQRAADYVTNLVGSWRFIIVQSSLLLIWIVLNVTVIISHWDPYQFILMNLVLSTQAAFTAPIIMMSQNRQALRDRLESHNDYEVNVKSEAEIRAILEQIQAQNQALSEIYQLLQAQKSVPDTHNDQ